MTGRATASVHVFRVPEGWSTEQAWEYIRREQKFPKNAPKKTRFWVNVYADQWGRLITWEERVREGSS